MDLLSLVARLTLDSSEYEKGIGSAVSKAGQIASGVGRAAAVAVGAATTAITGFAAASVNTGLGFDESMSKVAAISGATGKDFDDLRDKAQEMGASTKFSATEAADAFSYMAMAGWKTNDMLNGIEGVMNLAAASGESLATTSDIVTDALTAFGLKAEDSGHFADVLAAASSNANTNVSMMGETFKYAAPIAGALGFSSEDTAEAIGLMANAGIKASQAGTSLRMILNKMAGPIDIAGEKLGNVTIETTKADGTMRDLSDILDDCRKAFKKLSPAEKAVAAESIAGKNAMSGFLALMNAGEDDVDKLRSAIEDCDGASKKMAATMQDNLAGDITIFKSALEGAQIVVSDKLTPSLRKFVQFGTDGLSRITKAFKEDGLSGAMNVFGDVLSDGITIIFEMLPQMVEGGIQLVGALAQGLVNNAGAIGDAAAQIVFMLADYVVDNMPQFTQTAITMIQGLGQYLQENASKLVDTATLLLIQFGEFLMTAVPLLFDTAGDVLGTFAQYIIENLPMLVSVATGLIESFALYIAEALPELIPAVLEIIYAIEEELTNPDTLVRLLDAALEIIKGLAQGIINAMPVWMEHAPIIINNLITALDEGLPLLIDTGVEVITQLIKGILDSLPQLVDTAIQLITSILETLLEHAPELIEAATNIVIVLAEGLVTALPELIKRIPEIIATIVTTLAQHAPDIAKAAGELIGAFIQGMLDLIGSVGEAVGQVVQEVVNGFTDLPGKALDWGKDMISNFTQGIRDMAGGAIDAVKGLGERIKNFLGFSEPEEGPLSDFHTYAPDMMKLFAQGIHDNASLITNEINRAFDVSPTISAAYGGITGNNGAEMLGYDTTRNERQINVIFEVDGIQRLVYRLNKAEEQRVGLKLSTGGAY